MQRSFTFVLLLIVVFVLLAAPLVSLAQDVNLLPLAERGPYHVGQQRIELVDENRDGRVVPVVLWYPAVVPPNMEDQVVRAETSHTPMSGLMPNLSNAPYPVVLYSPEYSGSPTEFRSVLEPLVSHGFVVAGIDHWNDQSAVTYVDRPLDALFALDQLTALNQDAGSDLAGLMNTDTVGAVGWGSGAFTTTALSGARVDPVWAREWAEWIGPLILSIYSDWDWETIEDYQGQFGATQDDGLWTATTDPRIRAVVSYEPCATSLFGERGMAEATVPTLLVGGTLDITCDYELETIADYEQLIAANRDLLTLNGGVHSAPYGHGGNSPEVILQFVNAFLGNHLQGKTEYAEFLTPDYADTLDQVTWGVADFPMVDPAHIGNFTFTDGGAISLGEPIEGTVETVGDRVGYTLSLTEDSLLNLLASGTGKRTDTTVYGMFDPVLYVLTDQGEVLFWNDELSMADNLTGNFSAGVEGLALPAGDYTIVVGGFRMAGPFELTVELAQ